MENTYLKKHRKKNQQGFTLIEVLIASLILSAVFFAILSLVSNNTKQAVTLSRARSMDELFTSSKACLSSFPYTYMQGVTATQSINFGTNNLGCFTGSYNTNFSFTDIDMEYTNDDGSGSVSYWSYFSVADNTGSLKIRNIITDGTESREYSFLMVP